MTSSDPRLQTPAWRALRLAILDRDRWLCRVDGPGCTHVATEVDHIDPPIEGGQFWDIHNLRASCKTCNARRGWQLARRRADRYRYRTTVPAIATRF